MPERQGGFIPGLVAGAVIGGVIGGVLGVALAPRLLRRSQSGREEEGNQRLKTSQGLPLSARRNSDPVMNRPPGTDKRSETEADVAITQARVTLEQKIAELNQAIRETRAQLLDQDPQSSAETNFREDVHQPS